jgi:hypothetical protein
MHGTDATPRSLIASAGPCRLRAGSRLRVVDSFGVAGRQVARIFNVHSTASGGAYVRASATR